MRPLSVDREDQGLVTSGRRSLYDDASHHTLRVVQLDLEVDAQLAR